jgi:hypothetical protein
METSTSPWAWIYRRHPEVVDRRNSSNASLSSSTSVSRINHSM